MDTLGLKTSSKDPIHPGEVSNEHSRACFLVLKKYTLCSQGQKEKAGWEEHILTRNQNKQTTD